MASRLTSWALAVCAVLSFAVFVWLQFASINNRDPLLMVFSSFFFLGVATILALIVWRVPAIGLRALAVAVSIILIIGTVSVANSLTLNPPGMGSASNSRTIESFHMYVEGQNGTNQIRYQGTYSDIIHKPDYAASEIELTTVWDHHTFAIALLTPANVNGTLNISFALRPYESDYYPLFTKEVVFTNSTEQWFNILVGPSWGGNYGFLKEDLSRVRFEGYEIEFTFNLDLTGAPTGPPTLTFSIRSYIEVYIREVIVISTFHNNLAVALGGAFIGINLVIPAAFVFRLVSERRKNKEIGKQE
jgi:hypothetical protein